RLLRGIPRRRGMARCANVSVDHGGRRRDRSRRGDAGMSGHDEPTGRSEHGEPNGVSEHGEPTGKSGHGRAAGALTLPLLTDEHEQLRARARAFVAEHILPHVEEWEADRDFPRELFRATGKAGWFGHKFDPRWGGSGPDLLAE